MGGHVVGRLPSLRPPSDSRRDTVLQFPEDASARKRKDKDNREEQARADHQGERPEQRAEETRAGQEQRQWLRQRCEG